ncbi:protein C8orf37 homolog [Dendronephthya gigantea]|uniref:protein C8orf37 homolog n=1 Tax=Dendronephthya gigantea TaxID=151771 RepID=UPI00106D5931|nr:protein C8orf37 homolog [Dendronephthya gigantea]
MDKDIDDLLDEAELKFCKNTGPAKTTSKKTSASAEQSRSIGPNVKRKDQSDLNAMIDDICTDDGPVYKPHSSQKSKNDQNSQTSNKSRKCYPVYLGGSRHASGISSASVQRTCNQLRCTSCDFEVVAFDNYQWHSSCDYLFFRNNIPDFSKLKVNLIQKRGSRAYACQCAWRSVSDIQNIETDSELRWVCGKHI